MAQNNIYMLKYFLIVTFYSLQMQSDYSNKVGNADYKDLK